MFTCTTTEQRSGWNRKWNRSRSKHRTRRTQPTRYNAFTWAPFIPTFRCSPGWAPRMVAQRTLESMLWQGNSIHLHYSTKSVVEQNGWGKQWGKGSACLSLPSFQITHGRINELGIGVLATNFSYLLHANHKRVLLSFVPHANSRICASRLGVLGTFRDKRERERRESNVPFFGNRRE